MCGHEGVGEVKKWDSVNGKKVDSVDMREKMGFCKAIGIFMVVASRIWAWWGRGGGRVATTEKEIPLRCHPPMPGAVPLNDDVTLLRLATPPFVSIISLECYLKL